MRNLLAILFLISVIIIIFWALNRNNQDVEQNIQPSFREGEHSLNKTRHQFDYKNKEENNYEENDNDKEIHHKHHKHGEIIEKHLLPENLG